MNKKFNTITGEELLALDIPITSFVAERLLPTGLHILAALPKTGKSWLALWLALSVSKGEEIWGNSVTQGTVLYLCFEDNNSRIQTRLMEITEEANSDLHFCTEISTFQTGLLEQIKNFVKDHPKTNLVIIDTLQMAKGTSNDSSYASDYADLIPLKTLTYKLNIAVILIHHLKKKPEADKFHQISGTIGHYSCVIFHRNLLPNSFFFHKEKVKKSYTSSFPPRRVGGFIKGDKVPLDRLVADYLKQLMRKYNSQFSARKPKISLVKLSALLQCHSDDKFSPRTLSKNLLLCQKDLEKSEILFSNRRSNGKRLLELVATSDDSVDENSTEVVADTVTLTALG